MSPLYALTLIAASILGGVLIAAQGPIYARMASELNGNKLAAAWLAFVVATTALSVVLLVTRTSLPSVTELRLLPAWIWIGGLFGVYQVLVSMNAVPHLGVTLFIALVILGNLAAGLLYDHFGMFGLNIKPINFQSSIGVSLIVLGVWLVHQR
jgi:transporter family-2 protein